MNWFYVYKSQEEGYILTGIPLCKVLAFTEFWTCDLLTQIFFDLQLHLPIMIWPFAWLHTSAHTSAQYSGGTALLQSLASCPEHSPGSPRACTPWKSLPPICLAYMLPQQSPALGSVSSTWSSQEVSHPSTIQAQCRLTALFKWELVFLTWHGLLGNFYNQNYCRPVKSWKYKWEESKRLFWTSRRGLETS